MNRWNVLRDATLELMGEIVVKDSGVDPDLISRVTRALQDVATTYVVVDFEPQDLIGRGLYRPLNNLASFVNQLEDRIINSDVFDELIEEVYHEECTNSN